MKKIKSLMVIFALFFTLGIISINVNADSLDYKYSNYTQSKEEADKLIEEYGTRHIQSDKDKWNDDNYKYFVGYDAMTHKAIYTNKIQIQTFRSVTKNIKTVGTWKVGSYWGEIMQDSDGEPVYCGTYGANYPVGSFKYILEESTKVRNALSWGYKRVNTSASNSVDYGGTQLALWKGQGKNNVAASTLGVYQKVTDAYKGNLGFNNKSFNTSKSGSQRILNNVNQSNGHKVTGTATYKFTTAQLKKVSDQGADIYLYQVSSKKWVKAKANTNYATSKYSHIRVGTKDMSKAITIKDVEITANQPQIAGYIWKIENPGYQNIFNFKQLDPITKYDLDFTLKAQTGDIKVLKTNEKFGNISNAKDVQFGLYNSKADATANKNVVKKVTTNANGEAFFKDLLPGTFYVKELKGNANYIASTHIGSVKVSAGTTTTVDGNPDLSGINSFRNTWGLGNIEGYKVLDDFDLYETVIKDENGNPILLTSNGQPVTFIDDDYSMEVAKFQSKQAMIENNLFNQPIVVLIPEYEQVYETKQILDDAGNPIAEMVDSGEVYEDGNTIMIEKLDENGNIIYQTEQVAKFDDAGNPVVKAKRDENSNIIFNPRTLDLKYPDRRTMDGISRLEGVTFTLFDSSKKEIKAVKSNAKGEIIFTDITPGKYFIKETATLDGLQLSDREYPVEVLQNKTIYINDKKEIINIPEAAKLKIVKDDTLNNLLEGITFMIYGTNEDGSVNEDDVIDIVTTNDKGEAYFNYYAGKYFIKELTGSARHQINTDLHEVEIEANETTTLNIENDILVKEAFISKVDFANDKEVAGAKMCLVAKDGSYFFIKTKDGKQQEVKQHCWTSTDEAYMINLEPKKYVLTEEIAPKGYVKTTTLIPFEVLNDEQALNSVKVQNKLIANNIEITKTDATGQNELPGAKMCLYETDTDKKLECWTSTKKAKKMQLQYGKYYINEKIAPQGYIKAETNIPIIVNKDGKVQHIKVKNEAIKMPIAGGINTNALDGLDKTYSFSSALN